jgi:hypothetical protein
MDRRGAPLLQGPLQPQELRIDESDEREGAVTRFPELPWRRRGFEHRHAGLSKDRVASGSLVVDKWRPFARVERSVGLDCQGWSCFRLSHIAKLSNQCCKVIDWIDQGLPDCKGLCSHKRRGLSLLPSYPSRTLASNQRVHGSESDPAARGGFPLSCLGHFSPAPPLMLCASVAGERAVERPICRVVTVFAGGGLGT